MKILYGVQGTGNGHISRARMMAKHFSLQGADVSYLVSGRDRDKLFDMEAFGDYLHFNGLSFSSRDGTVSYLQTALDAKPLQLINDIRQLDLSEYDVVLTDFEPVSAWAAKLQDKTLIGMGHQYAFGEETPVAGENPMARFIMRHFAPASVGIGLHWHSYDERILPPIIDPDMSRGPDSDYILVYLPFEDQNAVTAMLQRIPGQRFVQYSSELKDGAVANVELRQSSYKGFKRDLCAASAVICNSGFELISECLHLGLPILTKPLAGQMEQLSNAAALQKLGFARTTTQLNSQLLQQWLDDVAAKRFSANPQRYPDVAAAIVNWVLAGEWRRPEELASDLWRQVQTV